MIYRLAVWLPREAFWRALLAEQDDYCRKSAWRRKVGRVRPTDRPEAILIGAWRAGVRLRD